MTDEQFNTLAKYEDNFRTAINSRWARHPGRTALATINATYSAAAGIQPRRVNFLCQQCVLDLLRNAGKVYFAEKTRREEEAKKAAEKKAVETASKLAETDAKPKAKKSSTRKPKAAETEK